MSDLTTGDATGGEAAEAETRNRLVRNLGALSLAAVLSKPLTYVTTLAVSRLLGPATMGRLVVAQTFVMAGSLFSDLGLTVLTMRDIVEHRERLSRLISATALVQLAAAILVSAVLVFVALFAPLPPGSARLLFFTLPLPLCLALNAVYALQAVEDMKRVAIQRLTAVVVTSLGTIVLVGVYRTATWAALMTWIGVLAADGLAVMWLWRRHGGRPARVGAKECWTLAKRSVPFVQNGVLIIILAVIDTASLAVFGTAREVGIYGVAWSTTFAAFSFVLLVTDATYPEMVRRWGQAAEQLQALSDQLIAVTLRGVLVATSLVAIEAPALVNLTLGKSYSASATVFRILVPMVPIGSIAVIVGFSLLAAGEQKRAVRLRLPTLAIFVFGCPIAADRGGVNAVAAVILAGTTVECLVFSRYARKIGVAGVVGASLRQWDYLVVPMVALVGLRVLLTDPPLYLATAVWLATALLVESFHKFSTLKTARALVRRGAS